MLRCRPFAESERILLIGTFRLLIIDRGESLLVKVLIFLRFSAVVVKISQEIR